MLYMILGVDGPGALERRGPARPAHLERVAALREAGRLVLAGPLPAVDAVDPGPAGYTGSLIVAEFGDLDAARRWASADPYLACGAWSAVDVRPFRQVMP